METIIATILGSVISGAVAVIVCVINSKSQHDMLLSELDKHSELNSQKIDELEQKVEKHNSVIERTFRLEEHTNLCETRFSYLSERLDKLEDEKS
ncbi:MAG: hypothetical protein KBS62_06590 [Oscillospiraceae bacterium]|nr:hypothetical protein [Candidatus Ruminococcus equi]